MAKKKTKKMSEKEKRDWDLLYTYVKRNIMGYDENQALSSTMVLRLKGLLTGKFIENNNTENKANYSYETILNTFKYCKPDIDRALRTNSFKNEQHKFLYVTKIIENNINNVYVRMRNAEKAKEEAKNVDTTIANYVGVKYQIKQDTKNKKDKFSDLW